ncbi:MAG: NADH-quinone oxidoreductase subunit L, partial [Methylophaga sp.]|nr:NADH-quinone oxidoreductase subunit L [Methylophaga sp.]
LAGYLIGEIGYGDFFNGVNTVMPYNDVLAAAGYEGLLGFVLHGLTALPVWLALAGVLTAWWLYIKRPELPAQIQQRFSGIHKVLENKYGFDGFNDRVFAGGSRGLGRLLSNVGDRVMIDGVVVNGTARLINLIARLGRHIQTGYLYHYAFAMILGVWLLLTWFVKG